MRYRRLGTAIALIGLTGCDPAYTSGTTAKLEKAIDVNCVGAAVDAITGVHVPVDHTRSEYQELLPRPGRVIVDSFVWEYASAGATALLQIHKSPREITYSNGLSQRRPIPEAQARTALKLAHQMDAGVEARCKTPLSRLARVERD